MRRSGTRTESWLIAMGCAALLLFITSAASATQAGVKPRLVLQITVDGLRGDLLNRYQDSFGTAGFNYLLREGAYFSNAHYLHANTETIVGHTTLATGATPAVHGMIGNVWYDRDSGQLGYNIEDPEAPLLPTRTTQRSAAQVDPAQRRARSSGRSPRGILVPTFSDTLTIASAGRAKNFAIAGKDRSAVAMAGKTGTAYWYSTDSGDFQTSSYYLDAYPDWVSDWNAERQAESFAGSHWSLAREPAAYQFIHQDDRSYEVDLRGYGRTFPHPFGAVDEPLFFTRLLVSPEGDRLLLSFAQALLDAEQLGQDDVTDYLSLSFSAVDAVNHFFGPSSLENEDAVVQLDQTLADLFGFIDQQVGLEHTLIVLSADHGMAEMPEYATELGHTAGRIFSDELLALVQAISQRLYGTEMLIKDFFRPYLFLDTDVIRSEGLDRQTVATAIARELEKIPGIGGAIPSHSAAQGGSSRASEAVRHGHHPQRSGDIYVFQQPYWFLFDRGAVGVMHGSPWAYDTHVPIIFTAPGIIPAHISRLVHPIDVAPTLSALLGLTAPAASQGSVLVEVVQ